jgi:hypothetical protein
MKCPYSVDVEVVAIRLNFTTCLVFVGYPEKYKKKVIYHHLFRVGGRRGTIN